MKLKDVRLTKEYRDLDYVLYYLRYNFKTLFSTGLYHGQEHMPHDMRPVYNAWKKDVVKLLREDKLEEAQKEIKKVGQINNGNLYRFDKDKIVWDLLEKYTSYGDRT